MRFPLVAKAVDVAGIEEVLPVLVGMEALGAVGCGFNARAAADQAAAEGARKRGLGNTVLSKVMHGKAAAHGIGEQQYGLMYRHEPQHGLDNLASGVDRVSLRQPWLVAVPMAKPIGGQPMQRRFGADAGLYQWHEVVS